MSPQYVRAKVAGSAPLRDVFTRESVEPGGEVTLLVRNAGDQGPLPCPRHPKRGKGDPKAACLCHGTYVDALVEQGVITDVKPYEPNARTKAAEKA